MENVDNMYRELTVLAFDCFGTVFDMSNIPKGQIGDYVDHVRQDKFEPYTFPSEWYQIEPHPDSVEGIESLQREGYMCVALSNGSYELIKSISDKCGIYWDHIIDLCKYKVYKPHIDAYRTVQKETGIPPEYCMMITANPSFGDIEGAKSIGMSSQVIRHGYPKDILELHQFLLYG
jgi:2-haloalkanoic acid dehalogenase type II